MTGNGPVPSSARTRAGTLIVLGTAPGPEPDRPGPDLLVGADAVFTGPPGPDADPESTALFYAEAWRVEPLAPRDAAARLDAWFDAVPGGTAVVMTAGAPERDVAMTAALEGLRRMRPELRIRRPDGVRVAPPERSSLPF